MKRIIDIPESMFVCIQNEEYCGILDDNLYRAIKNSIPYEEPKQGKWIRIGSLGNGNAHYECSNCHYGDVQAESQEVPYCWHCGAYMRKAVRNE